MKEKVAKIKEALHPIMILNDIDDYQTNIEYVDGQMILQILLTSNKNKVDFDFCSKMSHQISQILDEVDIIDRHYTLEVASQGIEKVLLNDDQVLKESLTKLVNIELIKPVNEKKHIIGKIQAFDEETITLATKEKTRLVNMILERENIKKITETIEF